MIEKRFTRRLNFDPDEYREVLERMEARCGGLDACSDLRARTRYPYRVADVPLLVTHPEGGISHFLVFGRNISRTGISVLHGGYVHPGSHCQVILNKLDGATLTVDGEIRHCRLFAGSCHEVGIHFQTEVDPAGLMGSTGESDDVAAEGEEEDEIVPVSGTILVAESFVPDHILLEHHLSVFGLEIRIAETPGATLDAVRRGGLDLILFGLSLEGDGLRTIRTIRELGLTRPVLVVTAENSPTLLEEAMNAGATSIVAKPVNVDSLVAEVRVHLGSAAPKQLFSTAADQPGMPPLIGRYVDLVRRIADQVERTFAEGEWRELREYCCQLKGSGCGYGFQAVTVAAMSVLKGIADDPRGEGTKEAVDRLVAMCRTITPNRTFKNAS